ncbi:4-hydroxy-3-methylbut-2-enyl diphosphate reductase, partial [Novosphingobium sp.]|uniref:4-hydroxy-3-methylbut-2-enyl diphosphate reductase n=1 Tax=Novosphingobium sp. TaxID=1874826 RepID=UPI0035B063F8
MAARTLPSANSHKSSQQPREVLLANPRGFCAGVQRAIDAVERALDQYGAPVYVRRAIVHNQVVVRRLERLGAIFVQDVAEIPPGAITILSAHGSARSVKLAAQSRNLRVVDAICPLVAKVHAEIDNWYRAGRHVLLIGHLGHPEIVGTLGQVPAGAVSVVSKPEDLDALDLPPNMALAYAVQTTFSQRDAAAMIEAIKARFPDVAGPRSSDICYATTNRQNAIEAIARKCDLVLVAGDPMSSNARRLVEVASAAGCPDARLIAAAAELPLAAVLNARRIGLTAAASTPADVVDAICDALAELGCTISETEGAVEDVRFRAVALAGLGGEEGAGSLEDRLVRLRKDIDAELDRAIGHGRGRD